MEAAQKTDRITQWTHGAAMAAVVLGAVVAGLLRLRWGVG